MPHGLTFTRLADLSHPIGAGMPRWPGDPPVTFLEMACREEDGYDLRAFAMGEHGGTHVNAPGSFLPGGADVRAAAPWPLLLPLAVLDLRARAAADHGARCTQDDVLAWEEANGRVPRGCLFVCNTGWHGCGTSRNGSWESSGGAARRARSRTAMRFPSFTPDAVHLLVHARGARGIGIDTHGVDAPTTGNFCAIAWPWPPGGGGGMPGRAGWPARHRGARLAGPLPLCGGTGAPVMVTAFIP